MILSSIINYKSYLLNLDIKQWDLKAIMLNFRVKKYNRTSIVT